MIVTNIGQNVVNYEMRKKFTIKVLTTDSGIISERNNVNQKDDQLSSETTLELFF